MLRIMRKQATNWLIKILLGAIVVVFIFWGVGSFQERKGGRVALVNGDQITLDEYKKTYDNLIEQLRQRFGNNLNEEMIELLQVDKQALNQLVNNRLLAQEARKLKFKVSDAELSSAIMKIGSFQSAGVFDSRLYKNILSRSRITPEEFEFSQKEAILIEKLRSFITDGVKVSNQEAVDWYNWANASVNIEYVLFAPESYKDIEPSNEEIKEYFENHETSYKTDALVKARYLHFDPDKYKPDVVIADQEVEYYFYENQEEFKKPKTVEARHILLKVDQEADTETLENTKKRALEILKMARNGEDFADLAKNYSEGPTRDEGGYLGTFTKETMVKPFSDRAFSMKEGEISDPVRTRFGLHIIKVERVNEASFLSLDEAKKDIVEKLTNEKARSLAYDEAEAISDVSFEGDDLLDVVKERKLNVLTTDYFARKGPEKGVSDREKFASAAFDLSVMEVGDIQDFKDGYYILQVIEKIPEEVPELIKVNKQVRDDLVEERQNEKAREDASSFLSELENGASMSTESKKYDLSPKSTGFFKRNDSIPNVGFESDIAKTAFKLSGKKKLPENPIKGGKGYFVIQFKERKNSGLEAFENEKAGIINRLLTQKQSRAFNSFLSQIKSRSEITIKEEFFNNS